MAIQPAQYLIGVYDDEQTVLDAVAHLHKNNVQVTDVFSPFPIHGIDQALGLRRSRLPKVAFWAGAAACFGALFMQVWMLGIDWPMDIGGKPYSAIPSFVPVTFELTVLTASLVMATAYFVRSGMGPGVKEQIADIRQLDDRFVVAVNMNQDQGRLRTIMQETRALDVRETTLAIPVAY